MTRDDQEREMLENACKGNLEASDFCRKALAFFHAADDFIDELQPAEFKITVLVGAQELYGHVYFLKHAAALHAVMRTCINTYADTVAWERSEDPAKRAWAEQNRHCGLDLILAVADLVGGWTHRRKVSAELRGYNLACAEAEKGKE